MPKAHQFAALFPGFPATREGPRPDLGLKERDPRADYMPPYERSYAGDIHKGLPSNVIPMGPGLGGLSEAEELTTKLLTDMLNELRALRTEVHQMRAAQYAAALSSSAPPWTDIPTTIAGEQINTTDQYIIFWKNNLKRPVRIRVIADWGAVTAAIKLSKSVDTGNLDAFEILSSAGTVTSQWIVLQPDETIYGNTVNVVNDVTGAVFRIQRYDPFAVVDPRLLP